MLAGLFVKWRLHCVFVNKLLSMIDGVALCIFLFLMINYVLLCYDSFVSPLLVSVITFFCKVLDKMFCC